MEDPQLGPKTSSRMLNVWNIYLQLGSLGGKRGYTPYIERLGLEVGAHNSISFRPFIW